MNDEDLINMGYTLEAILTFDIVDDNKYQEGGAEFDNVPIHQPSAEIRNNMMNGTFKRTVSNKTKNERIAYHDIVTDAFYDRSILKALAKNIEKDITNARDSNPKYLVISGDAGVNANSYGLHFWKQKEFNDMETGKGGYSYLHIQFHAPNHGSSESHPNPQLRKYDDSDSRTHRVFNKSHVASDDRIDPDGVKGKIPPNYAMSKLGALHSRGTKISEKNNANQALGFDLGWSQHDSKTILQITNYYGYKLPGNKFKNTYIQRIIKLLNDRLKEVSLKPIMQSKIQAIGNITNVNIYDTIYAATGGLKRKYKKTKKRTKNIKKKSRKYRKQKRKTRKINKKKNKRSRK